MLGFGIHLSCLGPKPCNNWWQHPINYTEQLFMNHHWLHTNFTNQPPILQSPGTHITRSYQHVRDIVSSHSQCKSQSPMPLHIDQQPAPCNIKTTPKGVSTGLLNTIFTHSHALYKHCHTKIQSQHIIRHSNPQNTSLGTCTLICKPSAPQQASLRASYCTGNLSKDNWWHRWWSLHPLYVCETHSLTHIMTHCLTHTLGPQHNIRSPLDQCHSPANCLLFSRSMDLLGQTSYGSSTTKQLQLCYSCG